MSRSHTTSTQTRIALTVIKILSRRAKKLPKGVRLLTLCASRVTTRRASSHLCLQAVTRVISKELRKKFSHMQCCGNRNQQPMISRNSNTTTAITRDFPACFVIVVKIIHRNRRCRAKPHMRLAPAVTLSSLQIKRVRSARSVTRMLRVERSRRFHRCAVSTRRSITRNTVVRLVPRVIVEIVVVLGSRFRRD